MFNTPVPMKRSNKFGSNYWYVYSPKINRMVQLFSDLEYDHWLLIEGNPMIKKFCEQPKKIRVLVNGLYVTSIFDMWIQRFDGSQSFIEIKYLQDLNSTNPMSTRSIRQTTVQQKWCEENGYEYTLLTEQEIRSNTFLLDNLKTIIPFLRPNLITNEVDHRTINQIIGNQRLTIKQIRENCKHLSALRINQTLYRMIYLGEINSDISEKALSLATEVWKDGK
ncbi:hypothetical protein EEL30_18345 [Brevibacillus laterosporus]|uniref:TnsA endonuclease N-terminal domain-containing protein n=1 Tax=Brevibacillus laterosporus TaxID=1465 RepID=A0A518VAS2_BRELA|nr:hypothetical protein EEL30_18345 [Brevibacillus laterosporus]